MIFRKNFGKKVQRGIKRYSASRIRIERIDKNPAKKFYGEMKNNEKISRRRSERVTFDDDCDLTPLEFASYYRNGGLSNEKDDQKINFLLHKISENCETDDHHFKIFLECIDNVDKKILKKNPRLDVIFKRIDSYSSTRIKDLEVDTIFYSLKVLIKLEKIMNEIFLDMLRGSFLDSRIEDNLHAIFETKRTQSYFTQKFLKMIVTNTKFERKLSASKILKPSLRSRLKSLNLTKSTKEDIKGIRNDLVEFITDFVKNSWMEKTSRTGDEIIRPIHFSMEQVIELIDVILDMSDLEISSLPQFLKDENLNSHYNDAKGTVEKTYDQIMSDQEVVEEQDEVERKIQRSFVHRVRDYDVFLLFMFNDFAIKNKKLFSSSQKDLLEVYTKPETLEKISSICSKIEKDHGDFYKEVEQEVGLLNQLIKNHRNYE